MDAKSEDDARRISGDFLLSSEEHQDFRNMSASVNEHGAVKDFADSNIQPVDMDEKSTSPIAQELRYHLGGLWLILIYSVVLVLTWIMTCVLCYKPLAFETYYDQTGKYSRKQYENNDWARKVIRTILSILAAVNIPITSTICAKAVVVYCSSPPKAKNRRFTARQTLTLADKGWSSVKTVLALLHPRTSHLVRSELLFLAMGLSILGVIIPALQGAFIDSVQITTRISDIGYLDGYDPLSFVLEPTPFAISNDLNIQDALEPVVSATLSDATHVPQSKLWERDNGTNPFSNSFAEDGFFQGIFNDFDSGETPRRVFASSTTTGTDTGVCRVLALSLGSDVTCTSIPQNQFPETCEGVLPFNITYSNTQPLSPNVSSAEGRPNFQFRACAPGNIAGSPWTHTRNRQDISEDLYVDLQVFEAVDSTMVLDTPILNYTHHCVTKSTMGYFELPNHWNNHIYSNVFDELPSEGFFHSRWEQETGFYNNEPPTLVYGEPDPPVTPDRQFEPRRVGSLMTAPAYNSLNFFSRTPGPLLLSILAIFGSGTFYDTVTSVNQNSTDLPLICRLLRAPFISLSQMYGRSHIFQNQCAMGNGTLPMFLLDWLSKFQEKSYLETALTMTTFWADQTMLDHSLDSFNTQAGLRPITVIPGFQVPKLHISPPAMAVISFLIALQVTGLLALAIYASSRPVWTESLDTFAVMRLGAAMARHLPLISAVEAEELPALDEIEGWIGGDGGKGEVEKLIIGGLVEPKRGSRYQMVEDRGTVRLKEKGLGPSVRQRLSRVFKK